MKQKIRILILSLASAFALSACGDSALNPLNALGGACEGVWSPGASQECWSDDSAGCSSWNSRASTNGGYYNFHAGQTCSDLGLATTS